MFKYIVKRLLLSILILLGISIILYVLIRLMPDDFVSKQIQNIIAGGSEVTQDMIDALTRLTDLTVRGLKAISNGWETSLPETGVIPLFMPVPLPRLSVSICGYHSVFPSCPLFSSSLLQFLWA